MQNPRHGDREVRRVQNLKIWKLQCVSIPLDRSVTGMDIDTLKIV